MRFTFTCNALYVDGIESFAKKEAVAHHIKVMLGMV